MNLPIVYLRGAEPDLLEAFNRYENRVEDLGGEFLLMVETGATLIAQFPEIAPVYHQSFRRLLLNRFPYGLFYVVEKDRIVIHAVLDLQQDAETIQKRLK